MLPGLARLLWFGGTSVLAGAGAMNWWIVRQANPHCYEQIGSLPPRQAAIVLGARVYSDGRPSPILEDRLATALALYRAGKAESILVSGDSGAVEYDESKAMRQWLLDRDVADEHIVTDRAGYRTLDTMQRAARIFHVRSSIVCTQRFHLHRAVFLARQAGMDAVGLCADRRNYSDEYWNRLRETFARATAFVDSYVLHTRARQLEDSIAASDTASDGLMAHSRRR